MSPFFSSLIGNLVSLVATLASARNPSFAPVIALASSGINAELAHIAAGNAPTSASLVENVAPGALALGAALAAKNNPAHLDAIAGVIQTVVAAIPTPSEHKDIVAAAPLPSAVAGPAI